MSRYISRRYHKRIIELSDEGYSLEELAIMYDSTVNYIEAILDNEE